MEIWQQLGFFAKLTLAIDLVPVAMAVIYLLRPTEHSSCRAGRRR